MTTLDISCLTRDYLCLYARLFEGNTPLAWQARQQFMNTPGIMSFEVSPHTGKVFIGLNRHVIMAAARNGQAMDLLQDYFPDLTASRRFQQLFPTLH
jgi:hypothetical protein